MGTALALGLNAFSPRSNLPLSGQLYLQECGHNLPLGLGLRQTSTFRFKSILVLTSCPRKYR